MSNQPSITIITPCYNGARYIEATLSSALNQTRPPLEVILVDDGSTDDSAAIAERFGAPVRVIRQPNQGEAAARNRGIAEARGTHILFLDADDLLAPESLEHLSAAVGSSPDAVAVMGCAWFTSDPAKPYFVKAAEAKAFYPAIIEQNIAPVHCWLVPTGVVRRASGFAATLRWFEDWDLWWRVGLQASTLIPVPYAGALYRQHNQSQLATTRKRDRACGHATIVSRLAAVLMSRPTDRDRFGEPLFWSLWSALNHAREAGVAWDELAGVEQALLDLARNGPGQLRRSRAARMFRLLGVRRGYALQRFRLAARTPVSRNEPQHQRA